MAGLALTGQHIPVGVQGAGFRADARVQILKLTLGAPLTGLAVGADLAPTEVRLGAERANWVAGPRLVLPEANWALLHAPLRDEVKEKPGRANLAALLTRAIADQAGGGADLAGGGREIFVEPCRTDIVTDVVGKEEALSAGEVHGGVQTGQGLGRTGLAG